MAISLKEPKDDCLSVLLVGETGVGKSSVLNYALGRTVVEVKDGPLSVTRRIQQAETVIGNRRVRIIDSPGMFDSSEKPGYPRIVYNPQRKERFQRNILKRIIKSGCKVAGDKLEAIALVVNLAEKASSNTNAMVKMIVDMVDLIHVIVIFTHGDAVFDGNSELEMPSARDRADERYRRVIEGVGIARNVHQFVFESALREKFVITENSFANEQDRHDFNNRLLYVITQSVPYCHQDLVVMSRRLQESAMEKRQEEDLRRKRLLDNLKRKEDKLEDLHLRCERERVEVENKFCSLNELKKALECQRMHTVVILQHKNDICQAQSDKESLEREVLSLLSINSEIADQENDDEYHGVDRVKHEIARYAEGLGRLLNTVCQDSLKARIIQLSQAVETLIQHRESHESRNILSKAADDLNNVFKHVARAKVTGSTVGIAAGILGVVGGGLLFGGVTAPGGIVLLAVAGAIGLGGGVIGVGATIGDSIQNRMIFNKADEWLQNGRVLSIKIIEKYDSFNEELDHIMEVYCVSKDKVIEITLDITDSKSEIQGLNKEVFKHAYQQAEPTINDWKTVIATTGTQIFANVVVTGMRVGGAVTRGLVAGAEAGAEAGATAARVALQGVGGAVVGLSAVFIGVDIVLLVKTAYDMHKNAGGTKLAKALKEAEEDIKKETNRLKPLAKLHLKLL